MSDKIINYYDKLKIGAGIKKPKNFNKHLI